jgi:hypothetical protein
MIINNRKHESKKESRQKSGYKYERGEESEVLVGHKFKI